MGKGRIPEDKLGDGQCFGSGVTEDQRFLGSLSHVGVFEGEGRRAEDQPGLFAQFLSRDLDFLLRFVRIVGTDEDMVLLVLAWHGQGICNRFYLD